LKDERFGGKIQAMEKEDLKSLKDKLFSLLERQALKRGEFVLSSGKTSKYYLDGRVITLTPEGAYLAGSIILNSIAGENIAAIGGPTLGADPITGAVAVLSHINKIPIKTFIVRKAMKEHGMQRQVEGPELKKGERVILVDDVATTGKALIEAKAALDALGVEIVRAMVIVDRLEGAKENLGKSGLKLDSIFTIKDFGL
jgi:orotate phosphoribosyltransferase